MMKYFLVKKTIPGTGLNKNNIVVQEVDGSIVLKTGDNEFLDVSWINVNNEDYFKDVTKVANNLNEPIFKVGEEVRTKRFENTIFKILEIKAQTVYKEGSVYNIYRYVIKLKNKEYTLNESEIIKINKYWFVNSEGRINEVELKNDEKDVWRKMTGNFFNTKEEAKAYVNNVWMNKFGNLKEELLDIYTFNTMIKMLTRKD